MIPRELVDPRAVQILGEYLVDEIQQALGERRPLEEKWKQYHRVYRAQPEQEVKTFPFYGAANFVLPVAASDADVVFARLMGILFAPDNLFSVRAKAPEMVDFAPRLQEFLQAVQFSELNAYNAVSDWVMEIVKLGTGILKTRYRREHKTVYEFREVFGETVEAFQNVRLHDHPEFNHVSLFDFLVPPIATDIKGAPWCSERVLLTWQQYMNRAREGIYLVPPAVSSWQATARGSHVLEQLMTLDKYSGGRGRYLEFWETWLEFDITGTGEPRPMVATIHLPTYSLVRLDWNPYISQEPPYDMARFLRQEKRFYGIGMCEMLEPFQDEVTAMHRQRIDSGTLANSMMFKGRSGVVNEDEPIFPGRWFILDNMDDVDVMSMRDGKVDSSVQYEPMTMQYAKHRSGVNEHVAGQFAPSIGYATAHTNLQQLQQATQRFDQTLREIREGMGGAIQKAVELYQQYDRPGKVYQILGQKDGQILEQFIQFPIELIRDGIGLEVTATSASLNKEVEIRTNTILMQMVTQFYREVIDALMLALNPQIPELLRTVLFQMVQGGTILMRRILDSHGVQDADDLVPHVRELLSGQLPIGQLQGDVGPAGFAGAQGFNGASQFPMLSGGLEQAAGGVPAGNGNIGAGGGNLPFAGGGTML